MSNLDTNGMQPSARVSILVDDLERIGNELRVHFPKIQEGTKKVHVGPDPLTLTAGGMKKLGPGFYEYIQPATFTGNYSWEMAPIIYAEYFDVNHYTGQMTKALVKTIQVPGAVALKIKMSYAVVANTSRSRNYLWIGAGLHEDASKVQGEYLPSFSTTSLDWEEMEEHYAECASCGLPVINGGVVLAPGTNFHPCEDEMGNFPIRHTGPVLPYIEREIDGDSFTCAWMVDFTGNHYTTPDEINLHGYYIEVIPYDVNNQPITTYQYIEDEIPNEFSIDDMDFMISKLNNYPNAEEVKF